MKPALIVIDMLNDFWVNQDSARKEALAGAIHELVAAMRSALVPGP